MTGSSAAERRMLRGAVLATLSALLAAVGHAAGGGTLPDLPLLLVLLPPLAGLFVGAAERSRSTAGVIVVLGSGQLALHLLMLTLQDAHHAAPPIVPTGAGMVTMHAVATVVMAVALRFADRAVDSVDAALRRLVARRPALLLADRPLAVLAVPGPATFLRIARTLAVAHIRRGPPVGC